MPTATPPPSASPAPVRAQEPATAPAELRELVLRPHTGRVGFRRPAPSRPHPPEREPDPGAGRDDQGAPDREDDGERPEDEVDHEEQAAADGEREERETRHREPAAVADEVLLLAALEDHAVVRDRSDHQQGRHGGKAQRRVIEVDLEVAELREALGERERQEEGEQDLHAVLGDPHLLEELGEVPVEAFVVRLVAHRASLNRPGVDLGSACMAPLITRAEARALGDIEDHDAIEALVERAWEARQEHFGDATDLCSLVNAKSGGCAEDCGFCAQSRFAEADTPMHAMMEPEQILEHARAAEAAGAHRFCMVTQGQGLSKRDFEKVLAGAKLVAEQTNLKRCASIGHMSTTRARQLADAGIQRVHHNVETAESYYPEVSTTVRYEGRLRTIDAVREAGLETCVGGILNLGESREQRVEMAFELASIDPTSVPINLLNPRPGTKFGDRDHMDPWEAVKWIAIFRLILPGALFRLCGGRVENIGELQGLAVRAGLNGVMMGNFLTTLGSTPEEDRAMFEELGPNVARQPDNGATPRPDNRSGWLAGDTPAPEHKTATVETPIDLHVRLWDPASQLRFAKKESVPPRPDGANNAWPEEDAA